MKFPVSRRTILLSALLILMLTMIFFVWSTMLNNDTRTNDAYVNADYTLVAPKVSGYIKSQITNALKQGKHWPRWMTVTTK